jgi:signal transduction histidine kinase
MISDPNYVLQAVHDLRSPLSALRILMSGRQDNELISAVFHRIEAISVELLERSRQARQRGPLAAVIEDVLNEARVLAPQVQFAAAVFAEERRIPADFARALSNLVTNAVKSGATEVHVDARTSTNQLCISVLDNAGGNIPEHSAGLGLRQVRLFAKCAGGQVSYGPGRVTITLPSVAEIDSQSQIRVL